QPVRDYLDQLDWDKKPPPPPLPDEVVRASAARYREAYERITGGSLDDWPGPDLLEWAGEVRGRRRSAFARRGGRSTRRDDRAVAAVSRFRRGERRARRQAHPVHDRRRRRGLGAP